MGQCMIWRKSCDAHAAHGKLCSIEGLVLRPPSLLGSLCQLMDLLCQIASYPGPGSSGRCLTGRLCPLLGFPVPRTVSAVGDGALRAV